MDETYVGKPRILSKHILTAAALGLATGSIIGQLAGGSAFFLLNYDLGISLGVWLFFALTFTGIGIILGALIGIDDHERTFTRTTNTSQTTPSERP